MADGKSIYKTFFNGMPETDIVKFSDIDSLGRCNVQQFQSLLNNIGLIERLASLKDQQPYKEFFNRRAVLHWLLDRAIYELALHKLKIVEKIIIDR